LPFLQVKKACSPIEYSTSSYLFSSNQKDLAMTTITTPSGLQYIDTEVGTGATAAAGQEVSVHYTGWLFNDSVQGGKFDSSKDRNQPFEFDLGAGMVIKGWDEGVAGMQVGGKRTLIIPAALGYGARGAGGAIPPNATLKFDVELLAVRG
jgi:FKBP-type peptidyl-prolyl cis-trans isomerase FkpA